MIRSSHGIGEYGLADASQYWNLTPAALVESVICNGDGILTDEGLILTVTTPHTGRSPRDRFIVQESVTGGEIWWGAFNTPLALDKFERLKADVEVYLGQHDVFVRDVHACAEPAHRLKLRMITESGCHNLFAHNMFLRPTDRELADFVPEFTVLHAPGMLANPDRHGTRSSTGVVLNLDKREVLIVGTHYSGEIKKAIFSALNYLLPKSGVLSMHCSANIGRNGDTAIFFGLSGTGKTSLSSDKIRRLIGDDEHGWSDEGIFNIEGGCYAKVIRLSSDDESEIYSTLSKFGTILENVVMDIDTRELDLESEKITENTRASYPINFIANYVESGRGGHPQNVLFLTADAFGVLPPISKLTPEQAVYYFLSGYTAKLAGTEGGVIEPQATFSACFGAPFLVLHPLVYAEMLVARMSKNATTAWLINTGWSGGPYGVGSRIHIRYTRAMINAALKGSLEDVSTRRHTIFGVHSPLECPGVPTELLDPRKSWADSHSYDRQASELAQLFAANFDQFSGQVAEEILESGPRVK